MTTGSGLKQPATKNSAKRSILGTLFAPKLGPSIRPIQESTRIFVLLLASVFAIYKLIPKNYPGLRDPDSRISFSAIISVAWKNLRFTRDGAQQVILFFAIIGLMSFSAIMAVFAIFSLFVGHAHAQAADASLFTAPAPSTDVAQGWINYLFNNGAYPSATFSASDGTSSSMNDPFAGSISLQGALTTALATYSDAILVIAAMVLFYHLAAMVVETAHHGVPMGKRASQIWAPIRLVVAVGLLVPINGGLNCGQYIVIKIAEMGSGLASQVWSNGFLAQMEKYSSKPIIPNAPLQEDIPLNLILMNACVDAWNVRIAEVTENGLPQFNASLITGSKGGSFVLGGVPGTKFSYSNNDLAGVDMCGWYFIPSGGGNQLVAAAANAQANAISSSMSDIQDAAKEIIPLIPLDGLAPAAGAPAAGPLKVDGKIQKAIITYQTNLNKNFAALSQDNSSEITSAIESIKPYGWVMAGTFLNSIDRIQAATSQAITGSVPKSELPKNELSDSERPTGLKAWIGRHLAQSGSLANQWMGGGNSDDAWDIRKLVAGDMAVFDEYAYSALTSPTAANQNAQCAAMVGLSNSGDKGAGAWGAEKLFGYVDQLATANGVWSDGLGSQCSNSPNTSFALGIQFNGADPMTQMAFLGHANLGVAFGLLEIALGGALASGIPFIGGAGAAIASAASFFALIFWIAGFTLAFLVPLMPFMRFFFAALSWVAGLVEAIVAIPLVALAHLNPEGEGLPGQAKNAYFYVFNLLLRPVLIIFGLICGFILFFVGLSFLNYAYGIAVAGAGATSYGYASMSKMIYSILYVVIVYICANHSFQLIDHLPHQALQWMGASGLQMSKMGDADSVEKFGGAISAYAGKETMGKAVGGVGQVGKAAGAALFPKANPANQTNALLSEILDRMGPQQGPDSGASGAPPGGGGGGAGGGGGNLMGLRGPGASSTSDPGPYDQPGSFGSNGGGDQGSSSSARPAAYLTNSSQRGSNEPPSFGPSSGGSTAPSGPDGGGGSDGASPVGEESATLVPAHERVTFPGAGSASPSSGKGAETVITVKPEKS